MRSVSTVPPLAAMWWKSARKPIQSRSIPLSTPRDQLPFTVGSDVLRHTILGSASSSACLTARVLECGEERPARSCGGMRATDASVTPAREVAPLHREVSRLPCDVRTWLNRIDSFARPATSAGQRVVATSSSSARTAPASARSGGSSHERARTGGEEQHPDPVGERRQQVQLELGVVLVGAQDGDRLGVHVRGPARAVRQHHPHAWSWRAGRRAWRASPSGSSKVCSRLSTSRMPESRKVRSRPAESGGPASTSQPRRVWTSR